MAVEEKLLQWLLNGDVSIQFQARLHLLNENDVTLQNKIARQGWGKEFLSRRNANGHWSPRFYQPKWTSTHYTLLDLRNLYISPECLPIQESVNMVLATEKGSDGGINPARSIVHSDVCVTGMALNYAAYFNAEQGALRTIIDFLLAQWMPDGGFNCRSNQGGATHSSLHSTLSVMEGIEEYRRNGYTYRLPELIRAAESSREFILIHRLFRSHRSGAVIDKKMLTLAYPCRWKYDILRCLDHFRHMGIPYDTRMEEALGIVLRKRSKDGTWKLAAYHPGALHFRMEEAGKPSRWNTLRALRVLQHFGCI